MRKHQPAEEALQLFTVEETAKDFKVSPRQVRRWIAAGDLVAYRLGRQLRISKADRELFLRQRRGL